MRVARLAIGCQMIAKIKIDSVILLFFLLGCGLLGRMVAANLTIAEIAARNVYFEAIVTDVNSIGEIQNIYQQRLPRLPSVAVIQGFPTRDASSRISPGKGHSEVNGNDWLNEYRRMLKDQLNMAELVKVDQDILTRVVNEGHVEEKIISGKDPLLCSMHQSECRILWISVQKTPPLLIKETSDPMVHLFVKVGRLPSSDEAFELSSNFQRRFKTSLLTTSFRCDEWFINSVEFPVIYPFSLGRRVVTLKEVQKAGEVGCASLGWGLRCGRTSDFGLREAKH